MRVTADGIALVAARVGKASAEILVRLTSWERKAADLATERAVLSMIQAEITGTHPMYRGPLHDRLAQTKARVRVAEAALRQLGAPRLRPASAAASPGPAVSRVAHRSRPGVAAAAPCPALPWDQRPCSTR